MGNSGLRGSLAALVTCICVLAGCGKGDAGATAHRSPKLTVTKVWITNDKGGATACRLHAKVHNSSAFAANVVKVEYDVAASKFSVRGGRLLGYPSVPAGRDETYDNDISYAVPPGEPLAVRIHLYAGGDEVHTAAPTLLSCNFDRAPARHGSPPATCGRGLSHCYRRPRTARAVGYVLDD